MSGNSNIIPSNRATLVDAIDPDANAAGTISGAWIPMSTYRNVMAVAMAGAMGATGTLDFKLRQASDVSGTGAKDITGKAITQLTAAGTDDDKQAIINCRADELDVDNDFDHVQMQLITAVATSDSGAVMFGFDADHQPGSHVSTVDEVIS